MPFPTPTTTVTIADGASLSGPLYVGPGQLVGLLIPSGWDAADITFQGSVDGATYVNLYEETSDTEVTVQAGASRYIWLKTPIRNVLWMKIRSGTAGSPVLQSGAVDVVAVISKDARS